MAPHQKLLEMIPEIESAIRYTFSEKELLLLSFTHRSFFNEHREKLKGHNERLEFLGDAVLGLIVSTFLYEKFPQEPEGILSSFRSRLVDASFCAEALRKLKLEEKILLGRGEALTEGRSKSSIIADAFEALVGAIYLDGGYQAASTFILSHFEKEMGGVLETPSCNHKANLQDYSQKKYQKTPVYKVLQEEGPDHAKTFLVAVFLNEEEYGRGEGGSKRQAEQAAAQKALENLK